MMKRVLYLGFLILFFFAFGNQRALSQVGGKNRDKESIKKFAQTSENKIRFEEISKNQVNKIKKELRNDTFNEFLNTAYFDEQLKLIVLVLKKNESDKSLLKVDFSSFNSLEILVLSGFGITDNITPILPGSLTMLDLSGNGNLTSIDLNNLTNLGWLKLESCGITTLKTAQLPNSLKELNLNRNNELTNIELQELKKLERLHLSSTGLRILHSSQLPDSLIYLYIKEYRQMESVDLRGLNQLDYLNLSSSGIKNLISAYLPNSLKELELGWSKYLVNLNLNDLTNLKKLNLRESNLKNFNLFKFPKSLAKMNLSGCQNLINIDSREIGNLEELDLSRCSITHIRSSQLPNSLKILNLGFNENLKVVDLKRTFKLEKLDLSYCGLASFNSLKLPDSLKDLNLKGNDDLRGRRAIDFEYLTNLEKLDLSRCDIKEIDYIQFPPSLTELYLKYNENLNKVALIHDKLKILDLSDCNITELNLEKVPGITELDLSNNKNLTINHLRDFSNLKSAKLSNCNIEKLTLSNLPRLTKLYLDSNINLDIINLSGSKLEELSLPTEGSSIIVKEGEEGYIEIARIKFQREENGSTFIHFFDNKGKPKDCLLEGHINGQYARVEIKYNDNGSPGYRNWRASELNQSFWHKVKKNPLLSSLIPLISMVIYSFVFLIVIRLILILPNSREIQRILKKLGVRKVNSIILNLAILYWPNFRFKILYSFREELSGPANAKDKILPINHLIVSEIINGKESVPIPIIYVIGNINCPMVLRGPTGSGKSAFIENMIFQLYEKYLKDKKSPIPVHLYALQCNVGVLKAIKNKLENCLVPGEEVIRDLIKDKKMTVFIDGLNEGLSDLTNIKKNITDFISDFEQGNILVSTQVDIDVLPQTKIHLLTQLERSNTDD